MMKNLKSFASRLSKEGGRREEETEGKRSNQPAALSALDDGPLHATPPGSFLAPTRASSPFCQIDSERV